MAGQPARNPDAPRQVGKFLLGERIFGTSVWTMWRATAETGGAPVALKRIDSVLVDAAVESAKVLEIAGIAKGIRHPNIAPTIDAFEDWGELAVLAPVPNGHTVRAVLDAAHAGAGELPVSVAVRIVIEVLAALEALHGATSDAGDPTPIVPVDLSPENVLVTEAGEGVLLDVVVEAALAPDSRRDLPLARYRAPELLATPPSSPEPRSDLYAVGVLLWELLAQKPLVAPTAANAAREVLALTPPRLDAPGVRAAGPLPAKLAGVVAKALSRSPLTRYASADQMGRALLEATGGAIASPADVARAVQKLLASSPRVATETIPPAEPVEGVHDRPTAPPPPLSLDEEPIAAQPPPPRVPTPSRVDVPKPPPPAARAKLPSAAQRPATKPAARPVAAKPALPKPKPAAMPVEAPAATPVATTAEANAPEAKEAPEMVAAAAAATKLAETGAPGDAPEKVAPPPAPEPPVATVATPAPEIATEVRVAAPEHPTTASKATLRLDAGKAPDAPGAATPKPPTTSKATLRLELGKPPEPPPRAPIPNATVRLEPVVAPPPVELHPGPVTESPRIGTETLDVGGAVAAPPAVSIPTDARELVPARANRTKVVVAAVVGGALLFFVLALLLHGSNASTTSPAAVSATVASPAHPPTSTAPDVTPDAKPAAPTGDSAPPSSTEQPSGTGAATEPGAETTEGAAHGGRFERPSGGGTATPAPSDTTPPPPKPPHWRYNPKKI